MFKRYFSSTVWDKLPMGLGASPFTSWDFTYPYSGYSSSPNVFPLHILFPGQIGTEILEGKNKKGRTKKYQSLKVWESFPSFQRRAQLAREVANISKFKRSLLLNTSNVLLPSPQNYCRRRRQFPGITTSQLWTLYVGKEELTFWGL